MARETARKILVIDDEKDIADIIERFLVLNGFIAYKAYSGEEGLEILSGEPDLSLIILDEKMPGMSGTSFRKKMKEAGRKVPVIVMTGSIGILALSSEKKKLFKNLMIKPVRLSELLELINKLS